EPDVKKEPVSVITALGRLEPESEIIDVGAPAGSRIDRLGPKVKEGAIVNRDDPLAYLDSHKELAAAWELAKKQYEEARERRRAETEFGQAAIAVAKLKIEHADKVMPKQINAQKAEVRRSQAELDKCRKDLERSEKLLADRT